MRDNVKPARPYPPTIDAVVGRLARRGMPDEDRERRQWEKLEAWNKLSPSIKMQKCASVCRRWKWSLEYIPDFKVGTLMGYARKTEDAETCAKTCA